MVASITQGSGANAFNLAYTYDSRGNITSETRNGNTTTYEYDALGQLVRVNDPIDNTAFGAGGIDQPGTTWIYRYDRGGNILAKEIYDYTTGTVGAVIRTISFTYGDTNWKDKLTVFDNATYTYDSIGNLTQDAWWTYTWEAGRQLKKLSHGSGDDLAEIEFTYNHAGIRTKKVKKLGGVLQTTTEYILNGDKLVELIYTDHANNTVDILHFYYDAQGKPAMVKHGSSMYAYVYNLQGDVLGLTDNTGALVADYRYDAWGSQGPEINDDVGYLNPFRYRGYIYDVETGLYYLKSRYYNSMICRFVNADSLLYNQTFTYCNNNPISRADYDGYTYIVVLNIWECTTNPDDNGHYSISIIQETEYGFGLVIPGTQTSCGSELIISYGSDQTKKSNGIITMGTFEDLNSQPDYRYILGTIDDNAFMDLHIILVYKFMDKQIKGNLAKFTVLDKSFKTYSVKNKKYCGSFIGKLLSYIEFEQKNEALDKLLSMLQSRKMFVNRTKFKKYYPGKEYIIDYMDNNGFEKY